MARSRHSRGLRAYIRRRKAAIRREPGDQQAAIAALTRQFPRPQRAEEGGEQPAPPRAARTPEG